MKHLKKRVTKIEKMAAARGMSVPEFLMDVMENNTISANKAAGKIEVNVTMLVAALEAHGWTRTGTKSATKWHPPQATDSTQSHHKHNVRPFEVAKAPALTAVDATVDVIVRGVVAAAMDAVLGVPCDGFQNADSRERALLVDAERDVVATITMTVIDESPMPEPAALRQLMVAADVPVVRRHKVTGR